MPNRKERWRRFVQGVVEEHLRECERLRQRLGGRNESVQLARMKGGGTAMVYLEAENPERIVPVLAASEEPFDLWFKEWLLECHSREAEGGNRSERSSQKRSKESARQALSN